MKNKQFFHVMSYEFKNIVKNKGFFVLTLLFVVLILGAAFLMPILFGRADTSVQPQTDGGSIIVYDAQGVIDSALFNASFQGYEIHYQTTEPPADDPLAGHTAAIAVGQAGTYTFYGKTGLFDTLQYEALEYLSAYNRMAAMQAFGMDGTQIASIMTPPVVEIQSVGNVSTDNYALTYVLIMILYMSILLYGQMVAMSVATEKSSRAMELLVTSAKPNSLIFGKIIGVGCAGLVQLSAWILAAVVGIGLNQGYWSTIPFVSAVFEAPVHLFGLMLVFYVLGYFTFAALYGALGSLVSRIEEINSVATPVVLLYVAAFLIAFSGMGDPNTLLIKVASFVPFFSPMCMFVRVAMSDVPMLEILVSVAITTAAAWFFGWLAAKIYRVGVLMYGQRPSLKDLGRILKSSKQY